MSFIDVIQSGSKQEKWDRRFLDLAKHISNWSKDPSTKVGAVIVDGQKRIVSVGFNGLPMKVYDDPSILQNREVKYEHMIHGEINAILFAQRDLLGCTLYTYPFMPCNRCASMIVQAGITRVVSYELTNKEKIERWGNPFKISREIFKNSRVSLWLYGEEK